VATTTLLFSYSHLKNGKKPKIDALSILPDSCLVYLRTSNFFELNTKINSQSLIIDKLKSEPSINSIVNTVHLLDSLLESNEFLNKEFNHSTVHFALYNQNKNWLSSFNIKHLGNSDKFLTEFTALFKGKKTLDNLYEFKINTNYNFLFTIKDGIVILSNSNQLINAALNTTSKKLINNKNFKDYNTNLQENNSLSIFVNHTLFDNNKTKNEINFNIFATKSISVGKIDIEPNQIKINGLFSPDSLELISKLFNQQPQSLNFSEYLPLLTNQFSAYGFTDFNQLNKKNNSAIFWKTINDTALFNLQNEFYQNINNQLINFKIKNNNESFCLIPVTDSIKAFEQLSFICDSAKQIITAKTYKLKNSKNKLQLFYPFYKTNTNYVSFYKSHLYFSESKQSLQELITNLNITNLNKNQSFLNYKNQQLSENYNYIYYTALNTNKIAIADFFPINENHCKNLKHFSYTLSNENTNFKFRCNLLYESQQLNNEQNTLWSAILDTTSYQQPYNFKNHITNENEILIQDDIYNLYLINAKGNKLWKKKINETIQSEIYTVDIFKNNKFQLLFNTKNYLHLIDRNGNYVQGYPVKLSAEATAPLALFDYDNDKNYRLFISCKNKNIYNYTLYGIKQETFKPIVTDYEVNLPIQYIKVGLSDYLVALDKMGKIYTYSRKGEARIGLKNKTIENCSAFYVDASNTINSTFLVYVDDKNNILNKISFADKKEIKKLNIQIADANIAFHLIDNNRITDALITTPNQVLGYDFNGNLLFEKNNEKELTQSIYFADENNTFTLSFSKTLRQLFINDFNSQKMKTINANALPLISNLFNNNKKYIIYCNNNQLNCMPM